MSKKHYYNPHDEKVRNVHLENQRIKFLKISSKKNEKFIIIILLIIITFVLTES